MTLQLGLEVSFLVRQCRTVLRWLLVHVICLVSVVLVFVLGSAATQQILYLAQLETPLSLEWTGHFVPNGSGCGNVQGIGGALGCMLAMIVAMAIMQLLHALFVACTCTIPGILLAYGTLLYLTLRFVPRCRNSPSFDIRPWKWERRMFRHLWIEQSKQHLEVVLSRDTASLVMQYLRAPKYIFQQDQDRFKHHQFSLFG